LVDVEPSEPVETLCSVGRVLFYEDFGGNDPSDPQVSTQPVPSISPSYSQVYSNSYGSMVSSGYLVAKRGYHNGPGSWSQWMLTGDHTHPGDTTRGYFLEVDGRSNGALLYEVTINNFTPGADISFTAYVANVEYWRTNGGLSYVRPEIGFRMKDLQGNTLSTASSGPIPIDTTATTSAQEAIWYRVGMQFTVPSGVTDCVLQIFDNASASGFGNDFAIDDISVVECGAIDCPVPDTIVESYTVCDTILGFGWHDMAFYQSGTYYDTLRTTLSDGYVCDSIYYVLHLTFVPCDRDPRLSAELLTTSLTLCDGDDALSLEFDLQEGSPHQCRLTIDSDTMLVDVPEWWIGSNSLIIALTPDMAASLTPMADQVALGVALLDTLNALVTPTATCQITVLYDPEGVFAQKWDNVLAIYSPAYSPYGLTLTHDYQWYLNGQPIVGATGSYLHLDDATLQPSDFYQVEVTRLSDGVRRITCPYFPHLPSYAPAQSQLYDLMGRPLQSEPASGFYIRIEGDRQEKVMILR